VILVINDLLAGNLISVEAQYKKNDMQTVNLITLIDKELWYPPEAIMKARKTKKAEPSSISDKKAKPSSISDKKAKPSSISDKDGGESGAPPGGVNQVHPGGESGAPKQDSCLTRSIFKEEEETENFQKISFYLQSLGIWQKPALEIIPLLAKEGIATLEDVEERIEAYKLELSDSGLTFEDNVGLVVDWLKQGKKPLEQEASLPYFGQVKAASLKRLPRRISEKGVKRLEKIIRGTISGAVNDGRLAAWEKSEEDESNIIQIFAIHVASEFQKCTGY
jgi:hypothetical protein